MLAEEGWCQLVHMGAITANEAWEGDGDASSGAIHELEKSTARNHSGRHRGAVGLEVSTFCKTA